MFTRSTHPLLRALAGTVALTALYALTACSTEAWYEGAKRSAEHQCRQQPPGAVEECLARLNQSRYDRYEKERTSPRETPR